MIFLQLQTFLLLIIGLSTKKSENFMWKLFAFINSLLLTIIILPEIHFVIENIDDIQLATDALCTILSCITSLVKVITIQINRKRFYKLIWELKEMWFNGKYRFW